jgi:hypothetical protein
MSFNDLADGPSGHEDDRRVKDSFQRGPMPLCLGERSGQPGKQRHVPDWIDCRPEGRKILADLDQKRRHMLERVFYPDTDDVSSTSKVGEHHRTSSVTATSCDVRPDG